MNTLSTNSLRSYRQDILASLQRLRRGKAYIHIPEHRELHRKRPHSHFHATPELFIQKGGSTSFDCAGQTLHLNTGDFCVMPRGVPHAETPVNTSTPYGVIVVMFRQNDVYLTRARSDDSGHIHGYDHGGFQSPVMVDAVRYLDNISNYTAINPRHHKPYAQALLQAFLIGFASELGNPQKSPPTTPQSLVSKAESFIHMHLGESTLTVAAIAQTLGCTGDHLSRQFHRKRGLTLTTWIARERVEQARSLLANSTYNISEVGWASGFNDPSYFIRTFKRHMGITPRQYRERLVRGSNQEKI